MDFDVANGHYDTGDTLGRGIRNANFKESYRRRRDLGG